MKLEVVPDIPSSLLANNYFGDWVAITESFPSECLWKFVNWL